jgi:hypothetical protein
MRRVLAGLTLSLALSGAARAQTALGTYTLTPPGGKPLTFVLQKDASGKIGGSLSANGATFQVEQAQAQGNGVMGTLGGNGLRSYFEAMRDGANLRVIMADFGPDGKPDYAHAREFVMNPAAGGGAPAAQSGNPLGAAASNEGNPLATAAPDKFAGTFASNDVTLVLAKKGAGYEGTIRYRGTEYPATARPSSGDALAGSFTAGGRAYDMAIASAGDGKYVNLTTAGTTYMLARGAEPGNPLAGGASASGGGAPVSALAKTAQDQQIVNLILSTAWCSFSYSGGSTYTGGTAGTTRTSRAVFRADGTASETAGTETTTSGAPGQTYGNSTNGTQGHWRIENGMLMLSADGTQWVPQVLKIADNGSGAPIITSGGKEYMRCK